MFINLSKGQTLAVTSRFTQLYDFRALYQDDYGNSVSYGQNSESILFSKVNVEHLKEFRLDAREYARL